MSYDFVVIVHTVFDYYQLIDNQFINAYKKIYQRNPL